MDTLKKLRREIDKIDHELLKLFARRFRAAEKIARIKQKAGLPVFQPAREKEVLARRKARAEALDLGPAFIKKLYQIIFQASRTRQHKINSSKKRRSPAT